MSGAISNFGENVCKNRKQKSITLCNLFINQKKKIKKSLKIAQSANEKPF